MHQNKAVCNVLGRMMQNNTRWLQLQYNLLTVLTLESVIPNLF